MALNIFRKLGKWRDGTQDLGDAFNEDVSFSIAIIGKNPVVYSHDGNDYEDVNIQVMRKNVVMVRLAQSRFLVKLQIYILKKFMQVVV